LADCAFRHDTVSRLYDVYYSWSYSHPTAGRPTPPPPSGPAGRPRRRRRRRRRDRRLYLGVGKQGDVRTFRVKPREPQQVRHHRVDDDDHQLEYRPPRRVMFFQRLVKPAPSTSHFPAGGRVAVSWTRPPRPPPTTIAAAAALVDGAPEGRRKQRRRRTCTRLLSRCRQRRRRRRRQRRLSSNSPRRTLTTTDAAAVLS